MQRSCISTTNVGRCWPPLEDEDCHTVCQWSGMGELAQQVREDEQGVTSVIHMESAGQDAVEDEGRPKQRGHTHTETNLTRRKLIVGRRSAKSFAVQRCGEWRCGPTLAPRRQGEAGCDLEVIWLLPLSQVSGCCTFLFLCLEKWWFFHLRHALGERSPPECES